MPISTFSILNRTTNTHLELALILPILQLDKSFYAINIFQIAFRSLIPNIVLYGRLRSPLSSTVGDAIWNLSQNGVESSWIETNFPLIDRIGLQKWCTHQPIYTLSIGHRLTWKSYSEIWLWWQMFWRWKFGFDGAVEGDEGIVLWGQEFVE